MSGFVSRVDDEGAAAAAAAAVDSAVCLSCADMTVFDVNETSPNVVSGGEERTKGAVSALKAALESLEVCRLHDADPALGWGEMWGRETEGIWGSRDEGRAHRVPGPGVRRKVLVGRSRGKVKQKAAFLSSESGMAIKSRGTLQNTILRAHICFALS